jgi:hypothetical protein
VILQFPKLCAGRNILFESQNGEKRIYVIALLRCKQRIITPKYMEQRARWLLYADHTMKAISNNES